MLLSRRRLVSAATLALVGCATSNSSQFGPPLDAAQRARAADRLGWGANSAQLAQVERLGWSAYVEQQLRADPQAPLAPALQAQILELDISQRGVAERLRYVEALRKAQDQGATEDERIAHWARAAELLDWATGGPRPAALMELEHAA